MMNADEFRENLDLFLPHHSPIKKIWPDHFTIGNEVMWRGVWQQPGLEPALRAFATIAAQCVNGWDFGLRHQIQVGLTLGITPRKIKSLFTELEFYVGVPATVFALIRAQEVIDDNEEWIALDTPIDEPWLESLDEKHERGMRLLAEQWGDEAVTDVTTGITRQLVPGSSKIRDAYLFGEIWARSSLEPRERATAYLAALLSRHHLDQFRRHVGYAMTAGLSREEVHQVVAQAGWYRGWAFVEEGLLEVERAL